MHIILDAAGQVGSQVVRILHRKGEPVPADAGKLNLTIEETTET